MCLSNAYKAYISVKHNNLLHKLFLWQHVSTLLSHHQAIQRTDPICHIFIVRSGIPNALHVSGENIARNM